MSDQSNKTVFTALSLLALVIVAGFIAYSLLGSRNEQGPRAVTVAHWGSERILIYLPLYVAIDGGYMSAQGLDVKVNYSGNDDQVFATVASGAAQFGVGDPAFTAISREKGGNGRLVGSLVGAVTNWGVTKNPSVPIISQPTDLNGWRVTSFPRPSTTFTLLSDLKTKHNLDKFEIKETAFGTELAALQNNGADIAILLEPQTSLAAAEGYRVVWSVAKEFTPFLLTGISTTDDVIKSDPETIQKFLNGLQNAITSIRNDPDSAATILAKSFPTVPEEILRNAVHRMVTDGAVPESVQINADAWRKALEPRVAVGDLKSLDDAIKAADNSFADNATRQSASGSPNSATASEKKSQP